MPAATLWPVGPRMTTVPPVMYSQAWSPVPSTTASAAAVAHGKAFAAPGRQQRARPSRRRGPCCP